MATVKFRLHSKANKEVSIYIYLSTGRGNFLEVKTGFTIHPKNWSKSTSKPKQNLDKNKYTASELRKLEQFVYDEVNIANSEGVFIDKYWLHSKIDDCFERVKKNDSDLLVNHIQFIIDNAKTRKIKGSNKIGLSERRISGYKSFKGLIRKFEKYQRRKIKFTDISKPFVDRFTNWLLNIENYSVNYSGKQLDNLKTVCLDAEEQEIKINPYCHKIESFKERNEDRYIITLSFEELEKIRTADLKTEAQENARKWLLIGCEIGQRAGDLLKLTPESLRFKNGRVYIDIEQQKTGKFVTVGVMNPDVVEILENDFPYAISTQKLNKHIKKVCEFAKINEMITGKKYDKDKGRKVLKEYPKYDLITSHTFRRSFATNYYKKIPTPVLINITGHSKESMFLEYINRREDKDENADLFMKFYESMQKPKEPEMKVIKNASNQ